MVEANPSHALQSKQNQPHEEALQVQAIGIGKYPTECPSH